MRFDTFEFQVYNFVAVCRATKVRKVAEAAAVSFFSIDKNLEGSPAVAQ